jgi:uncharacterized protein GlcG (DUF336 family)
MNWKMNISFVNRGANQTFFEKMDGAYLGSGDLALKAQTECTISIPPLAIFKSSPTARISKGAWCQGLRWFLESLRSAADCRL